jgi:integrase
MAGNIQRRPNGKWRARYRDPAGREHARHFVRKIDAERWLAGQEIAKARGEWIDPARARVTVADWAPTWLATKSALKAKTRLSYESVLRTWVLPRWGRTPLAAIGHADVVRWQAEMRSQLGPSRTRQAVDVLSQCLRLAVRDGRLTRNVADGVIRPRLPRATQRFLSHSEVAKLAAECPPPYDLMVTVLAYTGLRFGEVAALQASSVDLRRGRIEVSANLVEVSGTLHRDTPKSHHRRSVPVPQFLRARLAEHLNGLAPADPLFRSSKGGPLRNSNFRHYVFDPAVIRAGLAPLTPHDLRDTAASLAIAAGANVKAVQRMLGHASAAMTLDVYAGLFDDDLDGVARRMNDAAAGLHPGWAADSVRTDDDEDPPADRGDRP